MSREERDRAISELRNEWLCQPHEFMPCSESGSVCQYERCQFFRHEHPSPFIGEPKKWHDDKNWPTLLREVLPDTSVMLTRWTTGTPPLFTCCPIDTNDGYYKTKQYSADAELGDAVCEAWLKWNSRSGSEAR